MNCSTDIFNLSQLDNRDRTEFMEVTKHPIQKHVEGLSVCLSACVHILQHIYDSGKQTFQFQ